MDAQQEFQRLKQAFKRREQKRQNIYIATVVDTTPRAESGYIVVRLKDGAQVYAHMWISEHIDLNQTVFIMPITQEAWNWYVVVGINATTAPETVPYVQPRTSLTSLVPHAFNNHEGTLDWSYINTGTNKVDLTTQVQGVLPVVYQQPQTVLNTVTINTSSIDNASSATGSVNINSNVAYVKRMEVTGGSSAKVYIYENSGALQYESDIVDTPFIDYGGYFLVDYSGSKIIQWKIDNHSGDAQYFTIKLFLINFASSVATSEITRSLDTNAIVFDTPEYDLEAYAEVEE